MIVLKGMALLADLYPHPGLRPTGDIDLWIAEAALDALEELLRESGYQPEPFYPDVYRRGPTTIDIHTHLLGAERIAARRALFAAGQERLAEGTVATDYGVAVRRLAPASELLLSGLHLMKHNAERLLWLVETNELAHTCGDADWARYMELADATDQGRSVAHVAALAESLLPGTVAERYRAIARSRPCGRFESRVLQRRATRGALPTWAPLLLFAPPRGAGLARSIFESLFPRPEIVRQIFRDSHTSLWRLYARRVGQLFVSVLRSSKGRGASSPPVT